MRRFDMREIAEIEISQGTKRKEEAIKFQEGEHKMAGQKSQRVFKKAYGFLAFQNLILC